MKNLLVDKYNVPVPRYTSYPTVPFWVEPLEDKNLWSQQIIRAKTSGKIKAGISLYIHLPFCEQLCTYCGCNKRITKNHQVERIYIDALLKEWAMYKQVLGENIVLKEIHLGGGTPTFFSPENLTFLLNALLLGVNIHPEHEFSFEGHPNNTTKEHLQALYDMGFRRVSFGVQDMDITVQTAINRIQPFEHTKNVTDWARQIGYTSINFDLIYGLPFQNLETISKTIQQVIDLQPDRIAFYSYAHVPWTKKSQRAYDEADLPKGDQKYALYQLGKQYFKEAGYEDVGMDHFALKDDSLLISKSNDRLHRNFMGYTTANSEVLIGLGVSAISDVFYGYRQNVKTVEAYYSLIEQEKMPIFRGIDLTEEDIQLRQHILDIACKGKTHWKIGTLITDDMKEALVDMEKDGLLIMGTADIAVTELGWNFIRNICAVFDKRMHLQKNANGNPTFSQAV